MYTWKEIDPCGVCVCFFKCVAKVLLPVKQVSHAKSRVLIEPLCKPIPAPLIFYQQNIAGIRILRSCCFSFRGRCLPKNHATNLQRPTKRPASGMSPAGCSALACDSCHCLEPVFLSISTWQDNLAWIERLITAALKAIEPAVHFAQFLASSPSSSSVVASASRSGSGGGACIMTISTRFHPHCSLGARLWHVPSRLFSSGMWLLPLLGTRFLSISTWQDNLAWIERLITAALKAIEPAVHFAQFLAVLFAKS